MDLRRGRGSPGWHGTDLLPDGSPIPEDYLFESWYLLDNNAKVIGGATRMLDMAGNEVQTTVYEDSVWTNLTYNFATPTESFTPSLDHGLALDLQSVGLGRITSFEQKEISISGGRAGYHH
jgi:hypothetical protein